MGGPGSGRKKGSGGKSSKGLNKTSSRPYLKAARKAKKQDAMLENFNPNRFKK